MTGASIWAMPVSASIKTMPDIRMYLTITSMDQATE
jgi:hypothetical protein